MLKFLIRILTASFSIAFISGCDSTSKSEDLNYSYSYNGCQTGEQHFSSMNDMCEGLKSENLNHRCARELRERVFHEHSCPGNFAN